MLWFPNKPIANDSISYSTNSTSKTNGSKNVFLIITSWFGEPINGIKLGLTLEGEDGVTVQNTSVELSLNLYLIAFWLVFVRFWLTGSALLFEVTILNKFLIFLLDYDVSVVRYSIL